MWEKDVKQLSHGCPLFIFTKKCCLDYGQKNLEAEGLSNFRTYCLHPMTKVLQNPTMIS